MARYFIHLSYDGTAYHGFQCQPTGATIQSVLQEALATLLRETVEIVGAGRTDAGVHARHAVAHFDYAPPVDPSDLTYRLNRLLPKDIAVQKIEPVADTKHARFSATARTYHYYIHTQKDPFCANYSAEIRYPLDFDRMNAAAQRLLAATDFAAFCKSHSDVKTTLCTVTEARWVQTSPHTWYFRITANRFLRNMVRAIVGTLIDVGRGRIDLDTFDAILAARDRCAAGESMPAHALCLEDVAY